MYAYFVGMVYGIFGKFQKVYERVLSPETSMKLPKINFLNTDTAIRAYNAELHDYGTSERFKRMRVENAYQVIILGLAVGILIDHSKTYIANDTKTRDDYQGRYSIEMVDEYANDPNMVTDLQKPPVRNEVDPQYLDNGVIGIPLQFTLSPICSQLNQELAMCQYFRIVNNEIMIDLSCIENDLNSMGNVKIAYMPPGTNDVMSYENLSKRQNSEFMKDFGVADSNSVFRIDISNRIGNDGFFQAVQNGPSGFNPSIVNSAGSIFILSDKRTKDGKNPCLMNIPSLT